MTLFLLGFVSAYLLASLLIILGHLWFSNPNKFTQYDIDQILKDRQYHLS